MQEIIQYIAEFDRHYSAGNATKHSYRPEFQSLLGSIIALFQVTNERCSAPDYIVESSGVLIGYVEAKDIGTDFNAKSQSRTVRSLQKLTCNGNKSQKIKH